MKATDYNTANDCIYFASNMTNKRKPRKPRANSRRVGRGQGMLWPGRTNGEASKCKWIYGRAEGGVRRTTCLNCQVNIHQNRIATTNAQHLRDMYICIFV
jgi:hypothetical protein